MKAERNALFKKLLTLRTIKNYSLEISKTRHVQKSAGKLDSFQQLSMLFSFLSLIYSKRAS
jgi:hypothetical protein